MSTSGGKDEFDSRSKNASKQDSAFRSFLRVFTYARTTDYAFELVAIVAAIGSGVALALVNLVMGKFMKVLSATDMSVGLPSEFMGEASKFSLYFLYIGIARFGLTYIYSSLFTYVAYRLTRHIRNNYFHAALSQETGYFDEGTAGSISTQATSHGSLIQAGIGEKLGITIQGLATFIAAFIIAFASHWKLTLIIICIVPVMIIVGGVTGTVDATYSAKILQVSAPAGAYAESIISGVRTVHAFNMQQSVSRKYDAHLQEAFNLGLKKNALYGTMFGSQYFIIYAGMGLAFWQGIHMISRGEIPDVGTVLTVLLSVIIAASSLTTIAPNIVVLGRAASAATELFILVDRKSKINPFDRSGRKADDVIGDIDMENVCFAYPSRPDIQVLKNFSLHIPAGKVTALVGASGSGKSTIIGLLERWYDPLSGTIRLDGGDIQELNVKSLRTNIRLVQQEPVLFNQSIFDNIADGLVGTTWEIATPEEQESRVVEAAKLAYAHEFIMSLPLGYRTQVGQKGGLLSGGQKQRIAIARSIVSNPKILLLDEATSALDPHAEGIVQMALDRASSNRTTIVIAHKLATIRHADNIVVVSRGEIVEQGRHEELVDMDGAYAKLVKAQDLSVTGPAPDIPESENEKTVEEEVKTVGYLSQPQTAKDSPKEQQKCEHFKGVGILYNILKLIAATPTLRYWYIVTIATCLFGGAVFPGQTLLLAEVLNVLSVPDMTSRGNFLSLMFFVMSLGCMVVYFILGWSTNIISQTLNRRFRSDMVRLMLKQDLEFFDRPENSIGALTSRLDTHPQSILELMGINIALVMLAAVSVVACSILSLAISWKLGLVGVCVGLPPMILSGYARIRLESKMNNDTNKRLSTSSSIASEAVLAIRTVSSLALEEKFLKRYASELDHATRSMKRPLFTVMIWFSLTQSIEHFVLALGFWWGSKLIDNGEITFYQFIVSFMGVYFSGMASGTLFSFSSSFAKGNEAVNYYFWLSSLQPSITETRQNHKNGPTGRCTSIDLQNIQFSYPTSPQTPILKDISLSIKPNQFIALVGASGCGKSTIVSLLQRFYDPTSGTININSTPLLSLNPILYRRQLGLVQQEPSLFPGTIAENISHGKATDTSSATPATELEAACRAANIWDFVCSLPDGLETQCGVAGSQLSGGQRQRIAIARALVRDPAVLLLDEATSALDTESERVVQRALGGGCSGGGRLTVAVAHRLSTVREADCIFVFRGGRVVERGVHGELVRRGGMYARMCEAQRLELVV